MTASWAEMELVYDRDAEAGPGTVHERWKGMTVPRCGAKLEGVAWTVKIPPRSRLKMGEQVTCRDCRGYPQPCGENLGRMPAAPQLPRPAAVLPSLPRLVSLKPERVSEPVRLGAPRPELPPCPRCFQVPAANGVCACD